MLESIWQNRELPIICLKNEVFSDKNWVIKAFFAHFRVKSNYSIINCQTSRWSFYTRWTWNMRLKSLTFYHFIACWFLFFICDLTKVGEIINSNQLADRIYCVSKREGKWWKSKIVNDWYQMINIIIYF